MGTRSLTYVYDSDSGSSSTLAPLICMYQQYDGYPEGVGKELAEFLNSFDAITNGISFGEKRKTANGMGCLAAQLVAKTKTAVGGVYLYPCKVNQDCGQEFEYHILFDRVVVRDGYEKILFDGNWKQFADFCGGKTVELIENKTPFLLGKDD